MTRFRAAPGDPPEKEPPSVAMRLLAVAMLLVPVAGLVVHGILYAYPHAGEAYLKTRWPMVAAALGVANLFANWFHYRRTRMGVDIASRILTYAWVLSLVWMLRIAFAGAESG